MSSTMASPSTVEMSTVATSTVATSTATVSKAPPKISYDDFLKAHVTRVGDKGADPFPMIERAWDFFAGKGIRTVFLSIGTSASPLADLDICESIGCPLHIVPLNGAEKDSWSEVSSILKARMREASASPFTQGVDTKWVLPKNVRVIESLPWWEKGTVDISGTQLATAKVESLVASLCDTMKLKDSARRIDILKVDTRASAPGLELSLLSAVFSAGFRPSVVIVHWSKLPDEDTPAMLAAGHLQCCGYSLMDMIDNKYFYFYNDDNMYEICSWQEKCDMNPIAKELIRSLGPSTRKLPPYY
jgi:hypothetical protein